MGAPLGSVTVPAIDPVVPWPNAFAARQLAKAKTSAANSAVRRMIFCSGTVLCGDTHDAVRNMKVVIASPSRIGCPTGSGVDGATMGERARQHKGFAPCTVFHTRSTSRLSRYSDAVY